MAVYVLTWRGSSVDSVHKTEQAIKTSKNYSIYGQWRPSPWIMPVMTAAPSSCARSMSILFTCLLNTDSFVIRNHYSYRKNLQFSPWIVLHYCDHNNYTSYCSYKQTDRNDFQFIYLSTQNRSICPKLPVTSLFFCTFFVKRFLAVIQVRLSLNMSK